MASNLSPADLNESKAGSLVVVIVLCTSLAAVAVIFRIYARWGILGKVFLDDWFILVGLLGAIGLGVCMGMQVLNGFGRHIVTLTPAELMNQSKASVGVIFFFHWCHMTIKTSIILQYLRICVMTIERRICYGAICVVVAEGITWIITLFFSCVPFAAMWTPHLAGARCINSTASFYAASVTTISADIAILLFPVLLLRHSLLPWHQKLGLGVVLAFGGTACIASILRVRYIYMSTNSADSTWDKVPNAVFGTVEINLAIMCSSVVTLKPLISRFVPAPWLDWMGRKLDWIGDRRGARLGRLTITNGSSSHATKVGSYSESEGAAPSTKADEKAELAPDVELGGGGSIRSESLRADDRAYD